MSNDANYSLMFQLFRLLELQLQEASQKGQFKVEDILAGDILGKWKRWSGIVRMAGAGRIAVVTFSEEKFAKGMGWGLEFCVNGLDVVMTFADSSALCEFLTTEQNDAVCIGTDDGEAAWKDEFVVEMSPSKARVTVAISVIVE